MLVVDLQVDLDLAVVGHPEARDRARLDAADLDQVALDELAGVRESRMDGVAPARVEEEQHCG